MNFVRWTLLQAAHMMDFHTLLRFPISVGACSKIPMQTKPWNQKSEDSWVLTETFSRAVHHNTITAEWLYRCFIWLLKSTALPTGFSLKIPVCQGGDSVSGYLWLNLWLEKCLGSFLFLDPQISFLAWTVCGQKETFQWLQSRTHGQNYRVNNLPLFCLYLKYRCGSFRKIQPELTSERTDLLTCRKDGLKMKASSCLWEKRSKCPFPVFLKLCTLSESKMRDKGLLLVPKKPQINQVNQLQSCLSTTSSKVSTHRNSGLGAHGNAKKKKRDNSTFYFSGVFKSKEVNVLLHIHFKSTSTILFAFQVLTLRTWRRI